MKKVSIIIPHYNSVDGLEKLLKTIPKNQAFEIIVVDDKSDKERDRLFQVINNYSKDNELHFIENNLNKKNAGTSRNIGLEKATGDYILFADSDDYFLANLYKKIEKAINLNKDVVFFIPTSINVHTGEKSDRHLGYKKIMMDYYNDKNDLSKELALRYKFPVPWSKLIKRELIIKNNIKFDEIIAWNDTTFSAKIGYYMESFDVLLDEIYCVTRNKGSLTVNTNEKIFDSRVTGLITTNNFLLDKLNKEELKKLDYRGTGLLVQAIQYKYSLKKIMEIISKFKENNVKIIHSKYFNPIIIFNLTKNAIKKHKNDKEFYV